LYLAGKHSRSSSAGQLWNDRPRQSGTNRVLAGTTNPAFQHKDVGVACAIGRADVGVTGVSGHGRLERRH
jgi:hypothetical protein